MIEMGLFDFLKGDKDKNEEQKQTETKAGAEVAITNPVKGEVIDIEQVDDPVFSQKMMGDGFGVRPESGDIYAPGTGKVVSVFPTQHAVGLEFENGVEVLVHIGIDTVELDGGPFNTVVKEGDTVTPETKISTVDLEGLEEAGKDDTIIVVFTNMDNVDNFEINKKGQAEPSIELGTIKSK